MYSNDINSIYPINNPNDNERHSILEYILQTQNRKEDLDNIINLLKPPGDITSICSNGKGKNIKVAIIGLGESGLAAAFELKKIGCDITIFEASSRIGGRVYTHYFDRNKKYFGELGPMNIPVSHETTWHYINLFNINTKHFISNVDNTLFCIRDKIAVNDFNGKNVSRNIYSQFNLNDVEKKKSWIDLKNNIFTKYIKSLPCDIRRELINVKTEYSDNINYIDKLTYRAACENMNLSKEAVSMIAYLEGNSQFLDLGFLEMLQRYYTADMNYTYSITDGMINLPYSLYEAITDKREDVYNKIPKAELGKVYINFNSPVNGIYDSKSKDKVILKYTDYTDKDTLEEFDYVICAIPFSSLRRIDINPLFSNIKMQAINEMNYEIAQKIYLYFKERFWEKGKASKRILGGCSFTDLPLVSIYYPCDHGKLQYGRSIKLNLKNEKLIDEPGVLLASYSWGQEAVRLGYEEIKLQFRDVIKYIEKIHNVSQDYLIENLIGYNSLIWSDIQYIWGAGNLSSPGEKSLFSYAVTTPEMGNKVFFAGEHISQKHLSQQGALQSGMIAANNVAEQIRNSLS